MSLDTTQKIERITTGEIEIQPPETELFLIPEAVTVDTLSIPIIVIDSTPAVEVDIYAVRHPEFPALTVAKSSRLQRRFPPKSAAVHAADVVRPKLQVPHPRRSIEAAAQWGISVTTGAAIAAFGMLSAAWIAFQ